MIHPRCGRGGLALKFLFVTLLASLLGVAAHARGLQTVFIAWPSQYGTSNGQRIEYSRAGGHILFYDEPGSYSGDQRSFKGTESQLPIVAKLKKAAYDHMQNAQRFRYTWADNVRTMVVLGIDASLLPGLAGTGASIEVMGSLSKGSGEGLSYSDRVRAALEEAAQRLPIQLHQAGIRDQTFARLKQASDPSNQYGGPLIKVIAAYDYEQGTVAASEARKQLAASVETYKKAKESVAKLRKIADLFGAEKKQAVFAEAHRLSTAEDLPGAWAWRAWYQIDRDDFGKTTVEFIQRSDAAYKAMLRAHGRVVPFVITATGEATFIGIPGWRDYRTALGEAETCNLAYISYVGGVHAQHEADTAKTLAQRERPAALARERYSEWAQGLTGEWLTQDSFQQRALAIAQHGGIRGFKRDRPAALDGFRKAEKLGSIDAKNWVGLMLDHSSGVTNDPAAAVKKFQEAALLGSNRAKYNLAANLSFGVGTARDLVQARQYFSESGVENPTVAKFLADQLGRSWTHTTPEGDQLEVSLVDTDYPVKLSLNGRLKFLVRYQLKSVAAARIFPVGANAFTNYSPSPVLQNEGEHEVWIAWNQTRPYIGTLRIAVTDAATEKARFHIDVPVFARWQG